MIKRKVYVFFFFCGACLCCGQTTRITSESGFKHNYVVGPLKYIEQARDTAVLKYIATLTVSDIQTYFQSPAAWYGIIKVRARELGANTYLISEFQEDDHSISLTLKFFFAGEKFLDRNKQKILSDSVIVFNQTRDQRDTASFYLNDRRIIFDPRTFYTFHLKSNTTYSLSTGSSNITAKKLYRKKTQKARFFIIPANKNSFVLNRSAFDPNNVGVAIAGVVVTFGRNSAYELDYEVGRLLYGAYTSVPSN